jgi:hypothetical protein
MRRSDGLSRITNRGRQNLRWRTRPELGISRATLYRLVDIYKSAGTVEALQPRAMGRRAGSWVLPREVEEVIERAIREVYLKPTRPTLSHLVIDGNSSTSSTLACRRRIIRRLSNFQAAEYRRFRFRRLCPSNGAEQGNVQRFVPACLAPDSPACRRRYRHARSESNPFQLIRSRAAARTPAFRKSR